MASSIMHSRGSGGATFLLGPNDASPGRPMSRHRAWRQHADEPQAPAASRDAPVHPITSMQQAFVESLVEATAGALPPKPRLRTGDAKTRRELLLDQDKSDGAPGALWRLRPGQTCHELRKLTAQVSFGVYLLLHGLASNNSQVVVILQGHIDEMDEFLELTMEDIDLAAKDLTERIDYLKLPIDNMAVFSTMLEDDAFRSQIVDGNAKIEHILSRTSTALVQTVQDVAEGLRSTREFGLYLTAQRGGAWRRERPDVIDIFDAMRGNAEGWLNAFRDLQARSNSLNALVVKLDDMVVSMGRVAEEARMRAATKEANPQQYADEGIELSGTRGRHRSSSEGSVETVTVNITQLPPPPSPPVPQTPDRVSRSPPRLSLRFSRLPDERPSGPTYFNLAIDQSPEQRGGSTGGTAASSRDVIAAVGNHGRERKRCSSSETSDWPPVRSDSPTNDGALYLLQPRTYTPIPPAPLPSPRVIESPLDNRTAGAQDEPDAAANEDTDDDGATDSGPPPLVPEMSQNRRRMKASRNATTAKHDVEPGSIPGVSSRDSRATVRSRISSSPDSHSGQRDGQQGDCGGESESETEADSVAVVAVAVAVAAEKQHGAQRVQRVDQEHRLHQGHQGHQDTQTHHDHREQLEQHEQRPGQVQQGKRTSLRQRVSLKTTPPESILVPPPEVGGLQRPVFASPRTYQAYRTFVGPDSACVSDNDGASDLHSVADFSAPTFPGIIPSPHSDQQYFRPVQASPHSPLQQRPHTSGTAAPRYPHRLRNAPSAMGMSMLSSVSTADPDNPGGRTVKKKRSAFGWLKKAFSLDEEERMLYEQRKNEQTRNLYYDARSPQFLDGKRMR